MNLFPARLVYCSCCCNGKPMATRAFRYISINKQVALRGAASRVNGCIQAKETGNTAYTCAGKYHIRSTFPVCSRCLSTSTSPGGHKLVQSIHNKYFSPGLGTQSIDSKWFTCKVFFLNKLLVYCQRERPRHVPGPFSDCSYFYYSEPRQQTGQVEIEKTLLFAISYEIFSTVRA